MIATDFDGTLRTSDGCFGRADLEALERLGDAGYVRAIATGRSIYSLRRAIAESTLPIDYILFSSGAGVTREPGGEIVRSVNLNENGTSRAARALMDADLDFMIQEPIPESHRFAYHAGGAENPDFEKRIELYRGFCRPLNGAAATFGPATQLVAILPPSGDRSVIDRLRRELPECSVIRTTSPLDGRSTWIEIFPSDVSKAKTASWLAGELGCGRDRVLAVGNDYNDVDLLEWAGSAFVVGNAPQALREKYPAVASNDECGLAEAIGRWLTEGEQRGDR
jgi:hydroxymethylpyrimidine pyrophosphatase-like HAD family hydrolase